MLTSTPLSITNWNTAYGWGNHASVGYLTSLSGALLIDQTTPQSIINGIPLLEAVPDDYTLNTQLTNKGYVDSRATGGMKSWFFTTVASDIGGMYKATTTLPTRTVQTITTTAIKSTETVIASFLTEIQSKEYRVIDGARFFYLTARTDNTHLDLTLKAYIYITDINGANPTLLRTSNISDPLIDTDVQVSMNVWGNSIVIPTTSRVKFVIAAINTHNQNHPVTLNVEDDTFSRLDVPSPVGVTDLSGVVSLDQTSPQTTVGTFTFPRVLIGAVTDDTTSAFQINGVMKETNTVGGVVFDSSIGVGGVNGCGYFSAIDATNIGPRQEVVLADWYNGYSLNVTGVGKFSDGTRSVFLTDGTYAINVLGSSNFSDGTNYVSILEQGSSYGISTNYGIGCSTLWLNTLYGQSGYIKVSDDLDGDSSTTNLIYFNNGGFQSLNGGGYGSTAWSVDSNGGGLFAGMMINENSPYDNSVNFEVNGVGGFNNGITNTYFNKDGYAIKSIGIVLVNMFSDDGTGAILQGYRNDPGTVMSFTGNGTGGYGVGTFKMTVDHAARTNLIVSATDPNGLQGGPCYFSAEAASGEAFFNVIINDRDVDMKYFRLGHRGDQFVFEGVNDALNAVTTTPMTIDIGALTDSIYIKKNGNVLIGTNTEITTDKFQVDGGAYFDGTVKATSVQVNGIEVATKLFAIAMATAL